MEIAFCLWKSCGANYLQLSASRERERGGGGGGVILCVNPRHYVICNILVIFNNI